MKRTIACLMIMMALLVCSHDALAKKKQVYRVPGGVPIQPLGVSIDASYDPRFDDFIPGYKVVNVALVNSGFNILYLDPSRDIWKVKFAGSQKAVTAVHDLRSKNPDAWHKLPEQARGLVSYPLVLPIGGRQVVDIFVPDKVDVEKFTELDIYFKSIDSKIQVMVRQ